MKYMVRTVIKTYQIGAWGQSLVKLIEVEAVNSKEAEMTAKSLVDQQISIHHDVFCTAVFPKDCQLHKFRAEIIYTTIDEFDDYATEEVGASFSIEAPSIAQAYEIAHKEAPLHLHQYAYFIGVNVFRED